VTHSDGGAEFRSLQLGKMDGFGTITLINGGVIPNMAIASVKIQFLNTMLWSLQAMTAGFQVNQSGIYRDRKAPYQRMPIEILYRSSMRRRLGSRSCYKWNRMEIERK
jgi:hypothetical protein